MILSHCAVAFLPHAERTAEPSAVVRRPPSPRARSLATASGDGEGPVNVIDRLDHEWRTLEDCPRMARALRCWGEEDASLRHPDLGALVRAAERRDDPSATDALLAALARRAPDDPRAARVLLQLLLPGCKALVRRHRIGTRDERATFVVTATYERIRTYPYARRPRRIAANILLDVHQRLIRSIGGHGGAPVATVPIHAVDEEDLPEQEPEEVVAEAAAVLTQAVRRGVIDREAVRLIALTRVAGLSVAEVAGAAGEDAQTVRRRRLRAEARLRAHAVG